MALIVRIDVDRPYGKEPLARHVLSRISSDLFFPAVQAFGYLAELKIMLGMLNNASASAHVFFRRCTRPSKEVLTLMEEGGHLVGLHLENSRSFETFAEEKQFIERHTGQTVRAVSKHGSGRFKYGYHHFAPYEPDKYLDWARKSGMNLFFGNVEDPSIVPQIRADGFASYPSAFWLEPAWRDTERFTIDWLTNQAGTRDVVLLVHPDNVLADAKLTKQFESLITGLETRIVT
jgi:hypothetical protein